VRPAYRGGVSLPAPLAAIGDQRFVSLTTFRKNGAPVATPVWIAPDDDTLVVTTPADAGKVKRLRHNPRVEMRPCSRRGRVPEGAGAASGVAELVRPEVRYVDALRRKYGFEYRLVTTLERLLRHGPRDRVIVRITAA
jgi:PPOX class probable F420-dependent enzyme